MNADAPSLANSTLASEHKSQIKKKRNIQPGKEFRPKLHRMGASRALGKTLDNNKSSSKSRRSAPGRSNSALIEESSGNSDGTGFTASSTDSSALEPNAIYEVASPSSNMKRASTTTKSKSQRRSKSPRNLNIGEQAKRIRNTLSAVRGAANPSSESAEDPQKPRKSKSPKRRSRSPGNINLSSAARGLLQKNESPVDGPQKSPPKRRGRSPGNTKLTSKAKDLQAPKASSSKVDPSADPRKSKSPKRRSRSPGNINLSAEAKDVRAAKTSKSPKRRGRSPGEVNLPSEAKGTKSASSGKPTKRRGRSPGNINIAAEAKPNRAPAATSTRDSESPKRRGKSPGDVTTPTEPRHVQTSKSPERGGSGKAAAREKKSGTYTNRELENEVRELLGINPQAGQPASKNSDLDNKVKRLQKTKAPNDSQQAHAEEAAHPTQPQHAETREEGGRKVSRTASSRNKPRRKKSKANEELEQEVREMLKMPPKPSQQQAVTVRKTKPDGGGQPKPKPTRSRDSQSTPTVDPSRLDGDTPRRSNRSVELEDGMKRMLDIAAPLNRAESQKKLDVGEEIRAQPPLRKTDPASNGDETDEDRRPLTRSLSLKGFDLDAEVEKLDGTRKPPLKRSQSLKNFDLAEAAGDDFQVTFSGQKNTTQKEKIRRSLLRKEESVKSLGGGAVVGLLDELGGGSSHGTRIDLGVDVLDGSSNNNTAAKSGLGGGSAHNAKRDLSGAAANKRDLSGSAHNAKRDLSGSAHNAKRDLSGSAHNLKRDNHAGAPHPPNPSRPPSQQHQHQPPPPNKKVPRDDERPRRGSGMAPKRASSERRHSVYVPGPNSMPSNSMPPLPQSPRSRRGKIGNNNNDDVSLAENRTRSPKRGSNQGRYTNLGIWIPAAPPNNNNNGPESSPNRRRSQNGAPARSKSGPVDPNHMPPNYDEIIQRISSAPLTGNTQAWDWAPRD